MEGTSTPPLAKFPPRSVWACRHTAAHPLITPLDAQGLALQPERGLMQSGEYPAQNSRRDGFPGAVGLHSVNHKQEEASAVSTCFFKAVPE